jgi:GNAT superfamily N-acetyltransferase
VNGDSKQQQQDGGGGEGASGAEEFDAELEALMKSAEEDSADDGLLDGDYEYEDYDDEGEVLKEDDGLEDEEEGEKGEENEATSGFGYAGGGGGGGVRGGTGGGGRGGKVVAKGVTKAGLAVTLRRATPKDLNTVGTKLSWGNTVPSLPLGSANTHQEADNWVVAELTLGFGGIVAVCRAAAATTAETTTITTMTDVDVELDRPDGGSSGGSDGVSGSLTISSLVVAPSARQRGVAGALVDYVVATADASSVAARLAEGAGQEEAGPSSSEEEGGGDIHAAAAGSALGSAPAVSVSARLPIYKNKAAKKTIVAFFESRGIGISPT